MHLPPSQTFTEKINDYGGLASRLAHVPGALHSFDCLVVRRLDSGSLKSREKRGGGMKRWRGGGEDAVCKAVSQAQRPGQYRVFRVSARLD